MSRFKAPLVAAAVALLMCYAQFAKADALQLDFFLAGFQDVSGAPLSGAIVTTRNAANSAAKAVWEDKDQTLPTGAGKAQFNLDSEGRAVVFGDGVYTVIIYDEDDTGLTSPLYTFSGVSYETNTAGLALKVDKAGDTMTGPLVISNGTADTPEIDWDDTINDTRLLIDLSGEIYRWLSVYRGGGTTIPLFLDISTGVVNLNSGVAWSSGNDGSGSTLDADLLDGLDSTYFAVAPSGGFITGVGPDADALRQMLLQLEDGTVASTIKAAGTSTYNSEALAVQDNLGKGGSAGAFALNAGGTDLTVTVSDNTTASFTATITANSTGVRYDAVTLKNGTDTFLVYILDSTGARVDFTTALDAGDLNIMVVYLTVE